MESNERIKLLEEALKPFAAIADEYEANGLDEARPDWIKRGIKIFDIDVELYSGRGGKMLMTLRHVLEAKEALTGKPYMLSEMDPFIARIRKFYEASIPNLPWEEMSESRRNDIIKNYKEIMK